MTKNPDLSILFDDDDGRPVRRSPAGLAAVALRDAAHAWPTLMAPFWPSLYGASGSPPLPPASAERLLVGVVARELAGFLLVEDLHELVRIVAELSRAGMSPDEIEQMQRMLDIGGVGLGSVPHRSIRDGSLVEHWNAWRALYVLLVRDQRGLAVLSRAWCGARNDAERKRAASALVRWWRPREHAMAKSIGDLHGTAKARDAALASWRVGALP